MSVYNNGFYQSQLSNLIKDTDTLVANVAELQLSVNDLDNGLSTMGTFTNNSGNITVFEGEKTVVDTIPLTSGVYIMTLTSTLTSITPTDYQTQNVVQIESNSLNYTYTLLLNSFPETVGINTSSLSGTLSFRLDANASVKLTITSTSSTEGAELAYQYEYTLMKLTNPADIDSL